MAKTKAKREVVRQTGKVQQQHQRTFEEELQIRPGVAKRSAKKQQKTGFAYFVDEFPVLTGIVSLALVAGIISTLYAAHLPPFSVAAVADPCAWATNPSSVVKPAVIVRSYAAAPRNCIVLGTPGLYTARINTAKGSIYFTLDQQAAPVTVNSFVFLATHYFFNNTTFHRVETGILQGGDPNTANPKADPSTFGTGGPGYKLPDEFPQSSKIYTVGSVSMANAGKGTTGSQFFIATADDTYLQPAYTYFGRVYSGLNIAQALQKGEVVQSIDIFYNSKDVPGVAPTPSATATPVATATPAK